MSDKNSDSTHSRNVNIYQAATQTWVHAEQIRWTLLYNYLMATSILLLAWAAVFTASNWERRWILILLAIVGAALSLIWTLLEVRANRFAHRFHEVMLKWEEEVIGSVEVEEENELSAIGGPARATEELRRTLRERGRLASITTSRVLTLIPAIFAGVYALLFLLSLRI